MSFFGLVVAIRIRMKTFEIFFLTFIISIQSICRSNENLTNPCPNLQNSTLSLNNNDDNLLMTNNNRHDDDQEEIRFIIITDNHQDEMKLWKKILIISVAFIMVIFHPLPLLFLIFYFYCFQQKQKQQQNYHHNPNNMEIII